MQLSNNAFKLTCVLQEEVPWYHTTQENELGMRHEFYNKTLMYNAVS